MYYNKNTMFINLFDPDMYHYELCEKYGMSYLHYIWPTDHLDMNQEELDMHVTMDSLTTLKEKWEIIIKNVASSKCCIKCGIKCLPNQEIGFGLLDYIVLSNVPYGVDALFNLGFRTCLDVYIRNFYHPDKKEPIIYEGKKFMKAWDLLRTKETQFYNNMIHNMWLIPFFICLNMDIIGEIKKCVLDVLEDDYKKHKGYC